jgi:hypothetical protein
MVAVTIDGQQVWEGVRDPRINDVKCTRLFQFCINTAYRHVF